MQKRRAARLELFRNPEVDVIKETHKKINQNVKKEVDEHQRKLLEDQIESLEYYFKNITVTTFFKAVRNLSSKKTKQLTTAKDKKAIRIQSRAKF